MNKSRMVTGKANVPIDAYDAIQLLLQTGDGPGSPAHILATAAKRVADLWNDPPYTSWQCDQVREVFPELADALYELLGGGPSNITWDHVRWEDAS